MLATVALLQRKCALDGAVVCPTECRGGVGEICRLLLLELSRVPFGIFNQVK